MGFLLRVGIVVAIIYALSPVREPIGTEAARAVVGEAAESAGAAAIRYCAANPAECRRAAAALGSVAPREAGSARAEPSSRPRPADARPAR
ncbi:hypothetical protein NK718_04715 [Alsobacter sp. SYSU M60028]|uniref:Uncharacterized protein n=1 Tax=Alsobacter ponti TaxID=2962936 RepID=A0ABT1L8K3_9HYPH|nr:hypothetical protein [Alsobacter ponti]MCP8937807.1 hypothetical protein [Alsobacter ponti]